MNRFKPRVIRRVRKWDQNGWPKVVWDNRLGVKMERFRAGAERLCGHPACGMPIAAGDEYAKISVGPAMPQYNIYPRAADYHFGCVPPEARPMARFLR